MDESMNDSWKALYDAVDRVRKFQKEADEILAESERLAKKVVDEHKPGDIVIRTIKLSDDEYAKEVTQAIASTCHFIMGVRGIDYHCLLCSFTVSQKWQGRALNEQMLIHYREHLGR